MSLPPTVTSNAPCMPLRSTGPDLIAIWFPNSPSNAECSAMAAFGLPVSVRQHSPQASITICSLLGGSLLAGLLLRTSRCAEDGRDDGEEPEGWPGSARDMPHAHAHARRRRAQCDLV